MTPDFHIVGQGLSGSMMAWFLSREGKSVHVIDPDEDTTSSKVGAGIFNPITGRRLAKTWLADQLFPFAEQTYRQIESDLGATFYHPTPIARVFASAKEQNDWEARAVDNAVQGYMADSFNLPPQVHAQHGAGNILQGGWLDIPKFLSAIRSWLEEQNAITTSMVNYEELPDGPIIFCEGYRGADNPHFNGLPFAPAKGEVLTGTLDLETDHILNRGKFILPLGEGKVRVGATFDQTNINTEPTEAGKEEILEGMANLTSAELNITQHAVGIRPATRRRKPFAGTHPANPNFSILNGLGTKGVTLAPYFANQLTRYILFSEPLHEEVDIQLLKDIPWS